jgi:hypothetical protein
MMFSTRSNPANAAKRKALDELIQEGHLTGTRDFNREGKYWTDLTLVVPGG